MESLNQNETVNLLFAGRLRAPDESSTTIRHWFVKVTASESGALRKLSRQASHQRRMDRGQRRHAPTSFCHRIRTKPFGARRIVGNLSGNLVSDEQTPTWDRAVYDRSMSVDEDIPRNKPQTRPLLWKDGHWRAMYRINSHCSERSRLERSSTAVSRGHSQAAAGTREDQPKSRRTFEMGRPPLEVPTRFTGPAVKTGSRRSMALFRCLRGTPDLGWRPAALLAQQPG